MLSAESLGVIRETLPAVAGAIDEITPLFYSKMFAAYPELLRDLFNRGNQAAGEQPKALAASIAAFAGMVLEGNGAQYDSVLDRIAHKHASLGIVAEQYPIVYEHLFAAIAEVLGGAVTADVAKAWSEFYWLMADELIAREKALYDAAGVAPGDVWLQAIVVRRQLESADVAGFELRGVSGKLPNFLPGQYISVQVTLPDGARQIRQYSLSRGSTAGDWRIAVKRLNVGDTPAGEVSNFIYDNVFEGQQLRVSVPMGEFTLDDSADPLVLVSAGIGCTPIMGMLQELVATQSPREVVVLHADQSAAAHAYRHELADLVGRLPAGRLHTWYERAHVEHPADGIGRMSLDRSSDRSLVHGVRLRPPAVHVGNQRGLGVTRYPSGADQSRAVRSIGVGRGMTRVEVLTAALAAFWLGLVVAISFIEAPLKFRAPGVTIQLGLAIGRLVFRALNAVECVLAAVLVLLLVVGKPVTAVTVAAVGACVCLVIQLLAIRPEIAQRTNAIRDGAAYAGRSRIHLAYVAAECLKTVSLITLVALVAAGVQ